jgi:hypothetical protein
VTDQASGGGSGPVLAVFSQASSVRARAAGIFDAVVSGEWTSQDGKPGGGYLLALLGRAASSLADAGHVVAASAHYVRSPDVGPVEIECELLRGGRSISQVRARMRQDSHVCVEALVSTSKLGPPAAVRWDAGVPPLPHVPIEECIRLEPFSPEGLSVPILSQVEVRLDPESNGMKSGRPSGRGQLSGWLELHGEESFDSISLLCAVDTFPPPTLDIDYSWVSTAELTAYVRAIPVPGPVRVVKRARLIDAQWVDETCDVRDGTGRLVAQATQLARMPRD